MNKKLVEDVGFGEEVKLVEEKKCPVCATTIDMNSFTDELSVKEYNISGLCQKCQDEMYNDDDGEEEDCGLCDGTGSIIVEYIDCELDGWEPCDACGGSGVINYV